MKRVRYNVNGGLFIYMKMDNTKPVRWRTRLITLGLFLVLMGSAFGSFSRGSAAPSQDPPGPDRYAVTVVDYTKYYWWMLPWGKNQVECKIEVDHEGLPTPGENHEVTGDDK